MLCLHYKIVGSLCTYGSLLTFRFYWKNHVNWWSPQDTCVYFCFPLKVETLIHDNIRELVTWECKEHGVKSRMC
jgi:hypothetical protein